jgi:hypothetical protein
MAPLLAGHIIPVEGLHWLASEPEAMDAWLATLQGDFEEAGPLGAIVSKADGLFCLALLSSPSFVNEQLMHATVDLA